MRERAASKHQSRRCISPPLPIQVERSWGRHLLDYLSRHLRHTGATPSVHIAAKNAVPASFYERCTARHLPANTHVVLLEVLTNLQP